MLDLVDTHCHLDEEAFRQDLSQTIERAVAAGVTRMITIGITRTSSELAISLAEQWPQVWGTVGIHPNYTSAAASEDWDAICRLAAHPRIVGIGETGLDRYWDHAPVELQRQYFERHVELSRTCGKPFIIHCRDAEADMLACLGEWAAGEPLNGVMHAFCGSRATLERCLELGLSIAFGGMITFKKNAELRELARSVPADRLLVETDAPYLAPTPFRSKRNEPAHVRLTLNVLAQERNISREELCQQTTANARRLFKLD